MKLEKLMLLGEMASQTKGLKSVRRDSGRERGGGYDSCRQTGSNCWKRCRLRKGFTLRDLVQGCVIYRADQRLRLSTAQPPTRASGRHNIDNPQSRSAIAKQNFKSQLQHGCRRL